MLDTNDRISRILLGSIFALLFSAVGIFGEENSNSGKLEIYRVPAVMLKEIHPDTYPVPGVLSSEVRIIASPGEYEPASFVVRSSEEISDVVFETEELNNSNGDKIPASCIDIRVVKCWYQDRGKGYTDKVEEFTIGNYYSPSGYIGKKVLVPELLLYDENLIKVDYEKKHNYVRDKDGSYKIVSSPKRGEGFSGVAVLPVDDADSLQPVKFGKNSNKQFWVTAHLPSGASAGLYDGRILMKSKNALLGEIKLRIRVLPIELSSPYYISSIYWQFRNRNPKGQLENMVAHGVTQPLCYGTDKQLKAMKEVEGAVTRPIYLLTWKNLGFGAPQDAEKLQELKKAVKKKLDKIEKLFGHRDVYFYGIDEAEGEVLRSQRAAWNAIHEAGGKVLVAGYKAANANSVGDILDLMVCAGYPLRKEARKWHSYDHKVVCYLNPQCGVEQPEAYRRNYGILLWQKEYDGAMNYCYHWGWGDFCVCLEEYERAGREKKCKQHNMVYPTANSVIDTLQWEGYREGVDDIRYLTTLLKAIGEAKKSGQNKADVKKAERFLNNLKKGDINLDKTDLNWLRLEFINHILRIKGLS